MPAQATTKTSVDESDIIQSAAPSLRDNLESQIKYRIDNTKLYEESTAVTAIKQLQSAKQKGAAARDVFDREVLELNKLPNPEERAKKLDKWKTKYTKLLEINRIIDSNLQAYSDENQAALTRLNTIIQAYDHKQNNGALPDWYKDRPVSDDQLWFLRKVSAAARVTSDLIKNRELLEAFDINTFPDSEIFPNPQKDFVNRALNAAARVNEEMWNTVIPVMSGFLDDVFNRVGSAAAWAANGLIKRLPGKSDPQELAKIPEIKELQDQQLKAMRAGDIDKYKDLSAQIDYLDRRNRLVDSAVNFDIAKRILLSPSFTVNAFRPSVLNLGNRAYGLNKTISRIKPEYRLSQESIRSAIQSGSSQFTGQTTKDATLVTEHRAVREYDNKLKGSIKSYDDNVAYGMQLLQAAQKDRTINHEKREILEQYINSNQRKSDWLNRGRWLLDIKIDSVSSFILDWFTTDIVGKAITGSRKAITKGPAILSKAGKEIAKATFGAQSIMADGFEFVDRVLRDEIPHDIANRFSDWWNKWGNRFEGLGLGEKGKLLSEVARTAAAKPAHSMIEKMDEVAAVIGPNAHLRDSKYRTQVTDALSNIRDTTEENAIIAGEMRQWFLDTKTNAIARNTVRNLHDDILKAIEKDAEVLGGTITRDAKNASVKIKNPKDPNSEFIVNIPPPNKATKGADLQVLMHEHGHVIQNRQQTPAWQMFNTSKAEVDSSLTRLAVSGADIKPVFYQEGIVRQINDGYLESLVTSPNKDISESALQLLKSFALERQATLNLEKEAWQLSKAAIGRTLEKIAPESPLLNILHKLPSAVETEARALTSYSQYAKGARAASTIKRTKDIRDAAYLKLNHIDLLEKEAHQGFMKELHLDGGNVRATAQRLGFDTGSIDFTKRSDHYIRGYDALTETGVLSKIRSDILANPTYGFTPSEQKTLDGVIGLYKKWGQVHAEDAALGMARENYSPREFKENFKNIVSKLFAWGIKGPTEVGTNVVFPSFREAQKAGLLKGKKLEDDWAKVLLNYAQSTARVEAATEFEKSAKAMFGALNPAQERMVEYLKSGKAPKTKVEQLWQSLFLNKVKTSLTTGHSAFTITNWVDDFVRSQMSLGIKGFNPNLTRDSLHAWTGAGDRHIRMSKDLSLTPAALNDFLWRYGVYRPDVVAGDLMTPNALALFNRKMSYGVKAQASNAILKSGVATVLHPDASQHVNNILRGKVFIQKFREYSDQGMDLLKATFRARADVGRYLIDNQESGRLLEIAANAIPFIRYSAKTMSLYAHMFAKAPEVLGRLGLFLQNFQDLQPTPEERSYMSPYLREQFLYNVGRDLTGSKLTLYRLGLSYEAIDDLISSAGAGRSWEKLMSQNMIANLIYAFVADKDPFLGVNYESAIAKKTYKMFYNEKKEGLWSKLLGGVSRYEDGTDIYGKPKYRYEFDNPKRAKLVLGPGMMATAVIAHTALTSLAGETVGSILAGQLSPRGVNAWAKLSDERKSLTFRWLNYLTNIRVVSRDEDVEKMGKEFNKLYNEKQLLEKEVDKFMPQQQFFSNPENSALFDRYQIDVQRRLKQGRERNRQKEQ